MRAMLIREPGQGGRPATLQAAEVPIPPIGAHEVLVRVHVCAVCRTDLDVASGRVAAPSYPVIPGHQVVGEIAAVGSDVKDRREGDRVGIAWINWACGRCRWCLRGEENLCPYFRSTGCDANGGYGEYVAAPAAFTYELPRALTDEQAAPLLCAGAIGWRSLRIAELTDGDPLGLTGFGASAHLVLQLAKHRYPHSPVYVFARNGGEREFARQLGAEWAGASDETPPAPLAAIIDTTPAWKPVVDALPKLMPGGRLVINAIRKVSSDQGELARLDYARDLWMEREIKSVANVTRADVRELLDAAVDLDLEPTIEVLPLERANDALAKLQSAAEIRGATVLAVERSGA